MSNRAGQKAAHEIVFAEIIEFLRQINWPSEAVSSRAIRTFYQGNFGVTEVIIHLGEEDICLIIDPVVDRAGQKWRDSVTHLIEIMSREIKLIGIGMDDEGDLFVKVHLPIDHLNLEHFHYLLLGMCQVAENIILPVLQANAFDNLKAA